MGPEWVEVGGLELWAPLAYEGAAAALVRALKYRGAVALADPMAAQLAANAPPGLLERPAELVPVPLHPARRRRRGYNQAEQLACALARRRGLNVSDVLVRSGPAIRQVGRDRSQRLRGVMGSVEPARGASIPTRVVLVDDVATTGATLRACAAALSAGGARSVRAICFARTPGR